MTPAAAHADNPHDPATLAPARLVDSDHPAVLAFAQVHAQGRSDRERDVPLDALLADFRRHYPQLVAGDASAGGTDFLADVDRETRP